MIEPMMLYCAPIYAGIPVFYTKMTQIEKRAFKIIDEANNNELSNKVKQRTAIEVSPWH